MDGSILQIVRIVMKRSIMNKKGIVFPSKTKEARRLDMRKRRAANPDKFREQNNTYQNSRYKSDPEYREKKNRATREDYARNKDARLEHNRISRIINKDRWPSAQPEYQTKNKHKWYSRTNEYRRNYMRIYSTRPNVKIASALRHRLWMALRGVPGSKIASAIELLGCSIDEFKTYIQSKFKSGMSWDNYGIWHIDHIRACCKFDLADPAQQRDCFHFSNLQPLFALDNSRKGGSERFHTKDSLCPI